MIAVAVFVAAFILTFLSARRSLAMGIVATFGVGYVHGVLRSNLVHPLTTFTFDSALAGLYLGAMLRSRALRGPAWRRPLGVWVVCLVVWPAMLAMVPINHPLIQLVAFRASVWFLPLILVGAEIDLPAVKTTARWLAVFNVIALGVAIYLYFNGVPSLYPENAITAQAYRSRDVGEGHWRIPSTFLQAASYGSSMLLSLPLMVALGLDRANSRRNDGLLALVGTVAAAGGLLLCGSRQPIVLAVLSFLLVIMFSKANTRLLIVMMTVIGMAIFVASRNERFQRSMTLLDSDMVTRRVFEGSLNSYFFETLVKYPMGAGMGSAFGTSVPYFLARYAPTVIGAENEYSRIQVNQGLIGLALWVTFLFWCFAKVPRPTNGKSPPLFIVYSYSLGLSIWMTAWIGAGAPSSIPGGAMLFLIMGLATSPRLQGKPERYAERASIPSKFAYGIPSLGDRRG